MDTFSFINMHLRGVLPTISLYLASPLAIRDKYCAIPAVKSCSMEMAKGILAFPGCAASQAQTRLSCLGSILWATPLIKHARRDDTLNASFMILQSLHLISHPITSNTLPLRTGVCLYSLLDLAVFTGPRCGGQRWRAWLLFAALAITGGWHFCKIDTNRAYIMNEG